MKSDRILLVLGLAGFLSYAHACSCNPDMEQEPVDDDAGTTTPTDAGGGTDAGKTDSGTDAGGPTGDAMPTGSISFFGTECPQGWNEYAPVVGRTIVPNASGMTNVVAGSALGPDEIRTHDHGVSTQITLGSSNYVLVAGCCNSGVAGQRTINPTGTSAGSSDGVPYVHYLACVKTAAPGPGTIPRGLTAYYESATCPANWAKIGTSGRFVVGTPAGGTDLTEFGAGAPLASGETRSHSHAINASWTPASHGITGASGCCASGYATASSYGYTGTSSSFDSTPPYVQLTHCRRN